MSVAILRSMQQESASNGHLQITVSDTELNQPVPGAAVTISYSGDPESNLEEVQTNDLGQTPLLTLPTPAPEYSLDPAALQQPYAEYNLTIRANGYEPVEISGTELLPDVTAIQPVRLQKTDETETYRRIVIPAHTLFGNYPPKISESEIKPLEETGEIVLSRVVIPEFVVVHDGAPDDTTAENHYVRYRDYIKNVACNEIYATWPEASIRANVLAIMSFTLNRVYTEWYRNRGYDFTITSSTAFDQKWSYGRNLFDEISVIVDEIFADYLSRPNVRQPLLAQYCDGRQVQCPGAMSQWGSKYLGDQGYSAIDILRSYYGESLYINTAEEISGVPSSWPGHDLTVGSVGEKVLQLQEQLYTISEVYTAIPPIAADGIFGEKTQQAVESFQRIFRIPVSGIVDRRTWYKIQEIYVGITRIAELN